MFFQRVARRNLCSVRERAKPRHSHIHPNFIAVVYGNFFFIFCLNRDIPAVGLTNHSDIFLFAFDVSAASVLYKTDPGQINLLAGFINLESLRIAKTVICSILAMENRKSRSS